jgi:DNA polymerase V
VFQPHLEHKPIIILSNNDGCAVARSHEAKSLGIKMGVPYFEIKDICQKHDIQVFSSKYTLYSSMSRRVMSILKDFAVRQEIYSIDESFLDLTGVPNLTNYGQKIRDTVKQWTGIPVCIGIGHTKVLAKFANHLAKKHKFLNGVCNLNELGQARVDKAMKITSVSEVWGIGRKINEKLQLMGIKSVYDLKTANPKQISRILSVNIERIIYELNSIKCLELEEYQGQNKQIVSSRSFGQSVTNRDALKSSLTYHIEQASCKMRKQGLYSRQMIVFAHTNRFKDDYFSSSVNIVFPAAIDSFRHMVKYLDKALDIIYKPHIHYKKSGIIITDLISNEFETTDLFDNINIKHDKLLPNLELIKKYFGKSAIKLAAEHLSNAWKMQQNLISNRYTTDLDELLLVVA